MVLHAERDVVAGVAGRRRAAAGSAGWPRRRARRRSGLQPEPAMIDGRFVGRGRATKCAWEHGPQRSRGTVSGVDPCERSSGRLHGVLPDSPSVRERRGIRSTRLPADLPARPAAATRRSRSSSRRSTCWPPRCPTPHVRRRRPVPVRRTAAVRGNTGAYYDWRNSCSRRVADTGLGIPITPVGADDRGRLAASVSPLVGIGMPGHFLVGDRRRPRSVLRPVQRRRRARPPTAPASCSSAVQRRRRSRGTTRSSRPTLANPTSWSGC